MPKSNDAQMAEQALSQVFSQGSSNKHTQDTFEIFKKALRDANPTANFTSKQVHEWGLAYKELTGKELPATFGSPHALGKWMAANWADLGIAQVGSYGNRMLYSLEDSTDE